ncbi:MAG: TlpA family protein disulfide reductase [Bacteroidetes bacterium]|nr:TlpA family protein disulfide reductase [Bacteroidota bacterium]
MKKILLLILALSFSMLNGQKLDSISAEPSDLIASSMPEFSEYALSGNLWNSETLKGNVVVINFWFIGCLPCMKEISYLNELQKKYDNEDLVLLSIAPHVAQDLIDFNSDSVNTYSSIRKYLAQAKIEYEIIAECEERSVTGTGRIGPDCKRISGLFNVKGFPTTIIINKDGVVAHTTTGFAANLDSPENGKDYNLGLSEIIDGLLMPNGDTKK